jgi:hypothetical protein
MTMDVSQLTQMTTWLDEEHRRDKAELVRLQQRVASQESEMQDQARLVQELEGRVAGLQAQLLKFTQLDASLQQLKEEVIQMFAQADERRQQEGREQERVRAIERDNLSKAMNEVRRDLQRLPRIDEEVALRKAEQRRVSDSLLTLQQQLNALTQEVENKMRGLPFLEDGRQQDAKRIARLQQESLEALKRLEQHDSRLQRMEDVMQRQERDTGELKALVSQLRTAQREFIDSQLLEMEQNKRHIAEWVETMEVQVKKVDEFTVRLQEFADAFQEDRQVIAGIERFQERQEENEKRWRKELLRWDHQWADQAKRNQQFAERFNQLEQRLAHHQAQIDAAWRFLESQVSYQVQETRRWQGEMTRLLEERPKKE